MVESGPSLAACFWNVALCAALAFFLWAPLGYWVLRPFFAGKLSRGWCIFAAVGLGVWDLWVLLLGLLGMLYLPLLAATAIVAAALLAVYSLRHGTAAEQRDPLPLGLFPGGLLTAAFALLSLTWMIIVTASAFAPELSFDALYVHLPYARDAAASHSIRFDPNNWSAAMPALPLMSYITGFLFSGVVLAKLFNPLCYLLTGGVIYYFCRRWGSAFHGLAAALLFWSSPVALYEATTALIDLPLALFSGLAVLSLLEWTRQDRDDFLWLSAVSLGFASGCKYHAAFWFVPVALVITWHSRAVRKTNIAALVRKLLAYAAIVLVMFLPWLLRTWIYTGNPVFPLANGFFKSPYFTQAMERASWAAFANEGVGRSWQALLTLPWKVTFHPGPFRGTLGVVFFFGVLLAFFQARNRQVRYGLAVAGIHFYTWALAAQEIRYLLPLAPLLATLSSFGFLGVRKTLTAGVKRFPLRQAGTLAGSLAVLIAAVSSLPSVYPLWVKEWTYWHGYESPWRYLLGTESAQEYLKRDVPSIYVHDFINQKLTPRDRVLLLNDHAQYYSHVPTLYSFTVEGEGILLQTTEEGVMRQLRASHVTHVLLNLNGIAPLSGVRPRLGTYFFLDKEFQKKHLEPVFSKNNVFLYRVRY